MCKNWKLLQLELMVKKMEWIRNPNIQYQYSISVHILAPCSYCAVTRGYRRVIVMYNAVY
jgi:hypothetical protein